MAEENKDITEEEQEDPQKEETPSETTALIDNALKAAERIEAANKHQEELLRQQEELLAKQALGGRADAGSKQESERDRIEQENKLRWEGTGLNPFALEGAKALAVDDEK